MGIASKRPIEDTAAKINVADELEYWLDRWKGSMPAFEKAPAYTADLHKQMEKRIKAIRKSELEGCTLEAALRRIEAARSSKKPPKTPKLKPGADDVIDTVNLGGKRNAKLPIDKMAKAARDRLLKLESSIPGTSPARDYWNAIKAKYPTAIFLGIESGNNVRGRTVMFFPWSSSESGITGAKLHRSDVMQAMHVVGGGYKSDYASHGRHTQYKGWANCRVCGCRNGSGTYIVGDISIPNGAQHYKTAHKMPLNLFSNPVGSTLRIWYVAPDIYTEPTTPKNAKTKKEK